jgi:hypothetical protein
MDTNLVVTRAELERAMTWYGPGPPVLSRASSGHGLRSGRSIGRRLYSSERAGFATLGWESCIRSPGGSDRSFSPDL